KGVDEAGIADSIASGYRSGRFRPPADGAIGYMLSASSWSVDSGTRIFIPPHLHFYTPYGTAAQLGIDTTDHWVVPIRMERSGEPDATVVVGVRLRKPG
ncbi:MAG TPA: hypothetical protein VNH46_06330, partial [Gemmatimonadales bacterium]|nr:hypothetical protein [Gemmatimonadales bacterium]